MGRVARVTAVVCAAFDAATDDAILRCREAVRALGVPLPPKPPHRPHLSLAAARVERGEPLDQVLDLARQLAASHRPVPVMLSEVGRFGRAGVVWLGPTTTPQLAELQRDVDAAMRVAGWSRAFGERSDPTQWVPHCTLATRLPKPQLRRVQSGLAAGYRPIRGTVDALAVILVGGRGDLEHIRMG